MLRPLQKQQCRAFGCSGFADLGLRAWDFRFRLRVSRAFRDFTVESLRV